MRIDAPLIATLEDIVEHGSQARRAEMLQRITNLFIDGAATFTEEHIQLFDEIFNRLITKIEAKARFELSAKLARVDSAPREVVRQLAKDDDIAVARPVLQYSERLDEPDLLDVAKSKSQQHLLAISYRRQLAEVITEVLVRRGDREVVRSVAGNSGARLSQIGFSVLVRKAEKDGILAEEVGLRADIPVPLLRELLVQATQVVQRRLFATATPNTLAKIRQVLAEISGELEIDTSAPVDGAAGRAGINVPCDENLTEATLAKWAIEGRREETIAGLATLCKVPIEDMHRIMANKRADPALVACKALGFGWQTARDVILLQTGGHGMSALTLETKRRNYEKLSTLGAQNVMQRWCTIHGGDHATGPSNDPV